jgi:hypothetical protein
MLNKIIGTRYCKFEQISSHPWFKGFNWNDLISLDMKPNYYPEIGNDNYNEREIKPYLNYINSLKEWKENEKAVISPTKEKDFNDWFKNF